MNRYFSLLFFNAVFVSACGQNTNFHNLSSAEFNRQINSTSGSLIDVRTPSEFGNGHLPGAGPVFIDFYAPWCAPCRTMMPMIDGLIVEYKDRITIVKINADASKRLIKELQIGSVPYLAMFKEGEKIFEHSGILGRDELVTFFGK